MEIKGKVALVTGANRGLGKAFALALVAAGAAKVYASARRPKSVDVPGAIPVGLDVSDAASVTSAAETLQDVQLLINNAGIYQMAPGIGEGAEASMRWHLETNLFGVVKVSEAFAPVLKKNEGGAIVNMLTALTWVSLKGFYPYGVSKAAAWSYTNALRKSLAGQGTLVMAVHAAFIDTDMTAGIDAPKNRPEDVARLVIEGLAAGLPEVLVDGVAKRLKQSFAGPKAAYLMDDEEFARFRSGAA